MKTLSKILLQHIGHNLYFDLSNEQLDRIYEAMKEAIEQDRKTVSENVGYKRVLVHANAQEEGIWDYIIDKNSILNAPKAKI